jgi:hypothetical protein
MRLSKLPLCLCVVVVLVVLMPIWTTVSPSSQPFNSVAVAGHSTMGGAYCMCGCTECVCDPGETPDMCIKKAGKEAKPGKSGRTSPTTPESSGDGGALLFGSLMLMALARFLWR